MDGVSAHQLSLPAKKLQSFKNLNIPPRKLLTRRLAALSSEPSMDTCHRHHYSSDQETLFHKYLPSNINSAGVDDGSNPYASDEFRMYEFKIRKCTRTRSHDWTDCPFAHPAEKARRRCPRRFSYSGTMCDDFRRGSCPRGDTCEFAHGVFECWLHPSRYRTEACQDGKNCQRKICFFAHTCSQLRLVPPSEMVVSLNNKHVNSGHNCGYRRCHCRVRHIVSPTSVFDANKLSPPASPLFLPESGGGFSPISHFQCKSSHGGMTQLENKVSPPQSPSFLSVQSGGGFSPISFESSYGMTQLENKVSPPPSPAFSVAQFGGGFSPILGCQVESSHGTQLENKLSPAFSPAQSEGGVSSISHFQVESSREMIRLENELSIPSSSAFSLTQRGGGVSPISRFQAESSCSSNRMTQFGNTVSSYEELMMPRATKELMHKMKAMNMNAIDEVMNSNPVRAYSDSFAACNNDQWLIFSPAPSTPSRSAFESNKVIPRDCNNAINNLKEGSFANETMITRVDLEWVNDLFT